MKRFLRVTKDESIVFDAIRSASAIVVFLGHIFQILIRPSYGARWAEVLVPVMAGYAVMVFFVLSGYMVTSSILRNISERQFASFDVLHFSKDRLVRLYPPLILSLLLVLIVYAIAYQANLLGMESFRLGGENLLARERFEMEPVSMLGSLFFLQNLYDEIPTPSMNAPLWSLSFEFWFYFLAAAFTLVCFRVRGSLVALLLAVTMLAFADNAAAFFSGFAVWVSGAALAWVHQSGYLQNRKRVGGLACAAGAIGAAIFLAVGFEAVVKVHKYVFGVAFTGLLACIIAFGLTGWVRFRAVKLLAGSAKFSYTLYVIHWPLLMLVFALCHRATFGHPYLIALESMVAVVAVMYLSAWLGGYAENKAYILSKLQAVKSHLRPGATIRS